MGWGWITEPAGDFWNAVKEHAIDPLWPPDDEQDAWDLAKHWSSVAELMNETATRLEAQAKVSETVWVDDAGAEFTHALRNLPETFRVMADGMRSLSAGMDDYGNAIREAKIGVVIEIAANAVIWGALMGLGPLGGIFANTLARVVAGRLTSFITSMIGRGVSGGLTRALEIGVGAGIEIGTEALDEALIATATQLTSKAMGSRDEMDYGQIGEAALAGGIGGILGKGVGKVTAPITRATGAGLNRIMPDGIARNINAGIGSALNNSITSPVSGYIARNIDNLDALTNVDGYANEIKQNGIASGLMGAPRSMVVDSVQQVHSNGQQVADDWVNRVSGNAPEIRGGAPTGGGTPGGGEGAGNGAQTGGGTQAGGGQTGGAQTGGAQAGGQTGGEAGGTQGAQTGGQASGQAGGQTGGQAGGQAGGEAGGTQTGGGQTGGTQTGGAQTGGQAGGQTGGEAGGTQTGNGQTGGAQTGGAQAGGQTGGEAGGTQGAQTGGQASGQAGGQTGGQAGGQTGGQAGGQAGGQTGGEAGGTQTGGSQTGSQAGGTQAGGAQTGGPAGGQAGGEAGGTQTGAPASGAQTGGPQAGTGGAQTGGGPAAGEAGGAQTGTGGAQTGGSQTSGGPAAGESGGTQSGGAKTGSVQTGGEASSTQTSGAKTGGIQTGGEANGTQTSGETGNTQTGGEAGSTQAGNTQSSGEANGTQANGETGSTQTGTGGAESGGTQAGGPQSGVGGSTQSAGAQQGGVQSAGPGQAGTASVGVVQAGAGVQAVGPVGVAPGAAPAQTASAAPTHTSSVGQSAGSGRQSGTQTTGNAGQSSGQQANTQPTGTTGQSSSTQATGTGPSSSSQTTGTNPSTGTQTTGTNPSTGTQTTGTGPSSGTQGAPAAGAPAAGTQAGAATSQSGSNPESGAQPGAKVTGTPAAGAAAVASRAVAASSPSPANQQGSTAPKPTRVKVGRPPGSGPSGASGRGGNNNGGSGTTGATPASSPDGDPEISVAKIKGDTKQALDRARDAERAAQDALTAAKAAGDAVRRSLAEGTQEAADEAFAAAQQSALMKVNAEKMAYLAEEAANTAEQTAEKAANQPGGQVSEKRIRNARVAATKANAAAEKAMEAAIAAWRAATVDGTLPPPRGDRPMRGDPNREPDDPAVPLQPEVHVLGTYSPDRLTVVDGVITEIDGQPVAQKVRELAKHRAELYNLGQLAQEPAGTDTGNAIAVVLNVRTGVVLEATNGQASTAIPATNTDPKKTVAAKPLHEKLAELERQLRIPAHYPQWNNDGTPAPGPRTDLPGTPNEPLFRHAEVRAANEHLHAGNDVELTDLLADVWQTGEDGPALTPFCPNCTGVLPGVRSLSGRQEYSEQGNVQRINTVPPELPDGPTTTSTPPAASPTSSTPTQGPGSSGSTQTGASSASGGTQSTQSGPTPTSGQTPNAQTSTGPQTQPTSQNQPAPPTGQNPPAPNQTTSANTQTPSTGQNPANPPSPPPTAPYQTTTAGTGNTQTTPTSGQTPNTQTSTGPQTGPTPTSSQTPNAQTGTGSVNPGSISQSGSQSSTTQSGLPGGPNPPLPPGPTPTQPNPIPTRPNPTPTQPNPTPTQPNPVPPPPSPVVSTLPVGTWSRVDLVRHSRFAATRIAHRTAGMVRRRAYAAMRNTKVWTDAGVKKIKYYKASDSFEVTRTDQTLPSFIVHVVTGKVDQRGHAKVTIINDPTIRVEIRISTRVRPRTIERVIANAIAQADAIMRPDARTTDDALRHDTHPGDNTTLSVADHGREAEVRHLDRTKDEARVIRKRRIANEMRSLVEELGMHPDDDVAPQRNAVSTVDGIIENHTTPGERRPAWATPPTGYPTWKAFFFLHLPAELLPGAAAGVAILGTGAPPAIAWATWTATAVTGVAGTITKRWYGLQEKTRVDTGHGVNIKQRAHERADRRRALADEILAHTIAAGIDSDPKDEPVLQEELPTEPLGFGARFLYRGLPTVLGTATAASLGFVGLPIWNVIAYGIIGTATGLLGPVTEKYIRKAIVPMEWAKLVNAGRVGNARDGQPSQGDAREAELDEVAAAVLIEFLTRLRNIAVARSNTTGPPSVEVDPEKVIEPGYKHFVTDGSVGQVGDTARAGMDAVGMAVDGTEGLRAILEKAGTGGMRSLLGAVVGMLVDQKATEREYNMIVEQVVFDFGNKTAEQMEQEFRLLVEFVNAIGPLITTAETNAGLANTTPNTQLSKDILLKVVEDADQRPVGRQGFKAFFVKHFVQGGAMMGIMAGATALLNQPSAGLVVIGTVSGAIIASFPLRWGFRRSEQNAVDKTVLRDRDQERPAERAETEAMRDILIEFGTNEFQAAVNGQTTRNPTPQVAEPNDPTDPADIDQFVAKERELLANEPRPVKTFGARAATLARLSRLAQRVRVFEAHTASTKPLERAREDMAALYEAYQDMKNLKDPNDPDFKEVPPDHEALLKDAAERKNQEKPPGFRGGEPGTTPAGDLLSYLNRKTRTPAGRAFYTADEMPSTAKAVPRVPGMYTVDMHGDPDSVRIGSRYLTADELATLLEADPHWKGEPIRLLACETGQSANGFAQQLADRLGVTVYAPSDYVFVSARGSIYVTGWERRNGIVVPKMPPTGKMYAFDPAVPRAPGTPSSEQASNPAPVPPRVRVWWPERDEIDFGEVPEVDLPEELGELTLMRDGPTVYTGSDRLWPDELADIVAENGDWAGGPTRLQVRDGQVDPEFVQRLADLLGVPVVIPGSAVAGEFPTLSSGTLEVYNEPAPVPPPPGCRVYEPRNVTAGKGTS